MADDLYGGSAPKQGCFDRLPKVLHDAKPTEQAISDPIFNIYKRFFDSLKAKPLRRAAHFNFTLIYIKVRCPKRRRTFCIMNDEKGIVLNIM